MNLEKYRDVRRHWCSLSEPLTGADSLLAMMQAGWKLFHTAMMTQHPLMNGRTVSVYTFVLTQDAQVRFMRIIESPAIHRITTGYGVHIMNADKLPYRTPDHTPIPAGTVTPHKASQDVI